MSDKDAQPPSEQSATASTRSKTFARLLHLRPKTQRRHLSTTSLTRPIAPVDQRSRLGKDSMLFRKRLTEHCGPNATAPMQALIELAVQLHLRLMYQDALFALNPERATVDSNAYLAWSNALARTLLKLGLKGVQPAPKPTLADYLAGRPDGQPKTAAKQSRQRRRKRARLHESLADPGSPGKPSQGPDSDQ